jgi:uncharacterized protein involved in oxidation of intracellular sulfur
MAHGWRRATVPRDVKTLVVLNDSAYGTERSYDGLRLALSLIKRDGEEVRVFMLADAVTCALAGQKTPNGYYNLERRPRLISGQVLGTGLRSLRDAQGSSMAGCDSQRNGLAAGKNAVASAVAPTLLPQPETSMVRRGSTVRVRQRA